MEARTPPKSGRYGTTSELERRRGPFFARQAVVMQIEMRAARKAHAAECAFGLEAELLMQRDGSSIGREDADRHFLITQLLKIIFDNEQDRLARIAVPLVLGRDVNAVAERARARIAVMRFNRADRCARRIFNDPTKFVALQFLLRLRREVLCGPWERDRRTQGIHLSPLLAVEIPAKESLCIRRFDAAQAHLFALPEIH